MGTDVEHSLSPICNWIYIIIKDAVTIVAESADGLWRRLDSNPKVGNCMRNPTFKSFWKKLESTADYFELAGQIICIVQVVWCVPRGCMVEGRSCRSTGRAPAQAFAIAARARREGGCSAYSRTCEGVWRDAVRIISVGDGERRGSLLRRSKAGRRPVMGGIVQIEKLDSIPGRECRRHHERYFGKMVDSFQRNQVGKWREVMGARRRSRRRR